MVIETTHGCRLEEAAAVKAREGPPRHVKKKIKAEEVVRPSASLTLLHEGKE
jgi:hypothetical protein